MELGELIDEKGRFKKMSLEEEHIYGRPPKHVVFDEQLTSTPSPKNIRYMNGNDPHTYVIDDRGIPTPPPFPFEPPKGNKCIRRCKNLVREAWVVILMLYVLIIPVVVYQLNVKVRYVNKQVNEMKRSLSKPAPIQAPKITTKRPAVISKPAAFRVQDEVTTKVSTVYTRWGKTSCPNTSGSSLVYSGYVGGSHFTHYGGGANYLCLPRKPSYLKYDLKDNGQGKLYGVNVQLAEQTLFDVEDGRDLLLVNCAVCTVSMRSVTLMIPAATSCLKGWTKEYNGYLMSQKWSMKRTEYICVDSQLDVNTTNKNIQNTGKTGGYLNFVETACNILPCYVGGSYHTSGGAANYLCLPMQPSYGKFDQINNETGKIDGVEFEVNLTMSIAANAYCAVCTIAARGTFLMIPLRTECPSGWIKEYNGYVMSQRNRDMRRTEHICVDKNPFMRNETDKWEKGGFLHFVGMKSTTEKGNKVYENRLDCVVCSV